MAQTQASRPIFGAKDREFRDGIFHSDRLLEIAIPRKEIASFHRRWKVNELALFGSVLRRDLGPERNHILYLPRGKRTVQKMLLEIPTRIETERLYLRCYEAGDGPWYYAMSQQNRSHLIR